MWGRGIIKDPDFYGIIGEIAAQRYINDRMGYDACELDSSDRTHGDGGYDLRPCGIKIQVKSATAPRDIIMVRRVTAGGKIVKLRWQLLVAAYIPRDPVVDGAQLLGWAEQESFIELRDAMRGDHLNLVLARSELKPMCRLIEYLKAVREHQMMEAGRC